MAHHHFFRYIAHDIGKIEMTALALDLAVENNLQQHVAELFAQQRRVVGVNGFDRLVALLQKIAADALVVLLAVPRAASGERRILRISTRSSIE